MICRGYKVIYCRGGYVNDRSNVVAGCKRDFPVSDRLRELVFVQSVDSLYCYSVILL
jgi:hypothetical protein